MRFFCRGESLQLTKGGVNMEKRMVKQVWGLTAGAVLGLAALAGPAQADPANFLPGNSPILFKYNDLETQIAPPPGGTCATFVACGSQILDGIFDIITLSAPLGVPVYWTTGTTDGTQLNGFFTGLMVPSIPASGGGLEITFGGGADSIYNVPNNS